MKNGRLRGCVGAFFMLWMWCLFWGCHSNHISKRTVVVYSPHGKEMLQKIEADFENAYPEIDMVWLDMGSQTILERIRSQRRRPEADIWWGGPQELFIEAAREGLLQPYSSKTLSHEALLIPHSDSLWMPTFFTLECIMYNHQRLSPDEIPKEWDDLLHPKWKGKLVIRDPMHSGTMRLMFSAFIAREVMRHGSVDSGFKWLKQLHDQTKSYAADPAQLYLKLSLGETPLTIWNVTDALLQSTQHGFPFSFVIPESGTLLAVEGIAMINQAPHVAEAGAFYDFVTSSKSLSLQCNDFYRLPAQNNVTMPRWAKDLKYSLLPIDQTVMSSSQTTWLLKWQNDIRGKKD